MQTNNFKGQNLCGRSFKGDLKGADFSYCDLRGADFSGADLTGAKFCRAKMGRTFKASAALLVFQLLLGVLVGFIAAVGNAFVFWLSEMILKLSDLYSISNQALFVLLYSLIFASVCWFSMMQQRWDFIVWFMIIIVVGTGLMARGGVVAGTESGSLTGVAVVLVAVALAITLAVMAAVVVTVTIAGVMEGAVTVAVATMVTIVGAVTGSIMVAVTVVVTVLAAVTTLIYLCLGLYLGWRTNKKEEIQLSLLRNLSLKLACFRGTQFAFANLNNTDFSEADLRYARFQDAKITACNFRDTKNHHLALTKNSVLETRKVRELVVNGILQDTYFAEMNLHGLNFSGLDLRSADFNEANISFADFTGCDLSEANLSKVTAVGACFNQCKMTGAIIENWNIDTQTQLNDIECDYVYLSADKTQRNPPQGEFKAGEFSKLYQEISNTVDFIAHTPAELQALLRAIEKIKNEGSDIFIQQIERKTESVVIRVQNEGDTEFDKAAVYAEVQKQKEIEFKALEAEYKQKLLEQKVEHLEEKDQLRKENQDLLAELTKMAIQKQPNIHVETKAMNDNSRHQSFNGTANNSNINFGDNSTQTNTVQQTQNDTGELQELLSQLKTLINNSQLSDTRKQKALDKTKDLEQASNKPKEEQENIVQQTLSYFDGLSDSLENVPETAIKLGETVAKIASWFGVV